MSLIQGSLTFSWCRLLYKTLSGVTACPQRLTWDFIYSISVDIQTPCLIAGLHHSCLLCKVVCHTISPGLLYSPNTHSTSLRVSTNPKHLTVDLLLPAVSPQRSPQPINSLHLSPSSVSSALEPISIRDFVDLTVVTTLISSIITAVNMLSL